MCNSGNIFNIFVYFIFKNGVRCYFKIIYSYCINYFKFRIMLWLVIIGNGVDYKFKLFVFIGCV